MMICFGFLSPGLFTGQVYFMRHNYAATDALLTHFPNQFQTQVALTVQGTIQAGSCLPCHTDGSYRKHSLAVFTGCLCTGWRLT